MRNYITADEVASTIRMTRPQFSGTFLIVEGQTADFRVYKRLVDFKQTKITPAHNKDNALAALKILEDADFAGVVAIVDADFWRLEGLDPTSPNQFITDTHDLETMLLESPVLDKLLDEFGSAQKITDFAANNNMDVRQALLVAARPIGYLRWVSQRGDLSLKFEGIVFSRFIDHDTLHIDISELIREVKNKSRRHDLDDNDLRNKIDQLTDPQHNSWDICCGHDLVCILSFGLCRILGSNQPSEVKPEMLERSLRIGYESAYFLLTQLYQSLREWETSNPPFRIFSTEQQV
jgi:hypothetical protein